MKRLPFPAAPLLLLALLLLLEAMWGGLLRMGWQWPTLHPALPMAHGPLMIGGFLGALISLERVVAIVGLKLAPRPALFYLAPLAAGGGGVLLILGRGGAAGIVLITFASALLVVMMLLLYRLHPTLHALVMALGAAAWLAGNLIWLGGQPVPVVVLWWLAFLVLTIAGERLELSQLLALPPRTRSQFLASLLLFGLGVGLALVAYGPGVRVMGAGMAALALWLLRYDIARRRVKAGGQARFIAIALLTGYFWLAVSGLLALGWGGMMAGMWYDSWLHAVLLGFVFSMIFAHAPVVFPAVLSRPMPFSPRFYGHLALLHASLLLRVVGDLAAQPSLRQWGGLLNAIAILLFIANTLLAVRRGASPRQL